MDRHRYSSRHDHSGDCTRDEKIVDDAKSSYPASGLLFWLRCRLRLISTANNKHYNPTLPTAS